jgi:3-oxoacyl-[acyl-carrier-protein] synthase III
MTADFASLYLTGSGVFLPGEPVGNDALDQFIAPLDARSTRIKRRILADNGITSRHYAIDAEGRTLHSVSEMAAHAARSALRDAGVSLSDVSALCTGSSGGDLAMPGLANMVQGELGAGPMHTSSHQGVCASGMAALHQAASLLALSNAKHALVVASELPSRMFKRSRYAPRDYQADFDAHFLRWMLSDGAGAWVLSDRPRSDGLSLKLDWLHLRSFSGDHAVCMRVGDGGSLPSYLDYPSLAEAERDGAFLLRQDIRLLPRLFELGIHEYITLIRRERIDPRAVDHFLCHYSSAKFAPQIEALMERAGFLIPRERWFSNLERCGNTGAASIFVMLDALRRERELKPGQRVLCFVPESGRFTVSFAQFTVVGPSGDSPAIEPPHKAASPLLSELAEIWQDYQSRLRRTPVLRKIAQGTFTRADYLAWMRNWIPQVRYGSQWMRDAVANLRAPYEALIPLISEHANDEREDYNILYEDYRGAGGDLALDSLQRNAGGEALNAFMFASAARPNPVDLLGAIYIIEGTGQRVIPQLLPALRKQLGLPLRFLRYHGENDQAHLTRWLRAVEIVQAQGGTGVVETARATAELYLLQFQGIEIS